MAETTGGTGATLEREKKRNVFSDFFIRLIKEKPLGTAGAAIVLVLVILAIFADILAPYGMNEPFPLDRLTAPGTKYLLGTDNIGRDLLTRIIYGARITLVVGLCATTLATVISLVIGLSTGYIGGKFDLIVQRFVDAWMCFPGLVILILLVSVLGAGLWQMILALSLMGIGGSRSIRGPVMAVRNEAYIQAALSVGASTWRIILRHILPNVMAPTIILFTTRIPGIILSEASLSFLGLGIPPPDPSWGRMLSGTARFFMIKAPWMAIWPGLAISVVVYGINVFGDAIRDLLDPRMRGGVGRYSGGKAAKKRAEVLERAASSE
ncbi:MAG TPA: ABC transporter permease [Dehalococcoidia bacterium]|nr:ABC transporter permease [Dehalococcoidia bacterium]